MRHKIIYSGGFERMETNMKTITKVGIVTSVVAISGVGVYYLGVNNATAEHAKLLSDSQRNQMIAEQQYQSQNLGDKMKHVVNSIESQQSLTLVEEQGVTTLTVSQHDATWNKWLTQSSAEFSVEYKVLVGIDTNDITFIQDNDKLIVVFNDSAFHVQALEVVNKNILLQRSVFGRNITEDQKIAIEKQIVQEVKEKVMNDFEVQKACRDSLQEYIFNITESFGVSNVEVIG